MKKQIVMIGFVTLIICVSLSGCNQKSDTLTPEKNKFVGIWNTSTPGALTRIYLFGDGTWEAMNTSGGTWVVQDGKFIMNFNGTSISTSYVYTFSNGDKTLQLTSTLGETTIYHKR